MLLLLSETNLRKTPTGLTSSAPQNGKFPLRSIPAGKVSLSCGLAGRPPLRARPTHFKRTAEKLRRTPTQLFKQYQASTITRRRRSVPENLPPDTHQLYRLGCCDSHATSFETLSSPIGNSCRRRSVMVSSGTSEAVSRLLDPSRCSPLEENLSGRSSQRPRDPF